MPLKNLNLLKYENRIFEENNFLLYFFFQVKSFSHLFNILKVTDTFIACTDEEYGNPKQPLATMRPDDFFGNNLWPRKPINGFQRYNPKPGISFECLFLMFYFHYSSPRCKIIDQLGSWL
jgi:hypothetical protein